MSYTPVVEMDVYYHRSPEQRLLVGRLDCQDRRIAFEFDAEFRTIGLELSPIKLPLGPELYEARPDMFDGLHGLFDDSLPDGWGRLLLDRYITKLTGRPPGLAPLDRLAWVGSRAIGALSYEPQHELETLEEVVDLHTLGEQAQLVLEDKTSVALETLLRIGGSPQGARPKALVLLAGDSASIIAGVEHREGFDPYLVKFNARVDPEDTIGAIEYAYSGMAREAGVDMPDTKLLAPKGDHLGYFAIKRFDRRGQQRLHTHTVSGLLDAQPSFTSIDYGDLLRLTRTLTRDARVVEQMFRRAAFNMYAHNRDDHSRNFAFLMEADGTWKLAPAYDITFSDGPGGEHTMTIAGEGRNPTGDDLRQLARDAGIRKSAARLIIDEVREACSRWPERARDAGVPKQGWEPIEKELASKQ